MSGNLIFNMVRETSDHGPFNSVRMLGGYQRDSGIRPILDSY
jgi:hypothetical protein